jgi:hypothetical protein
MAQYVVNIAPVPDATNETDPIPKATVHIDVEDEQVLVRELTIRAPQGAGLATAELPYVDFELLLKAFARPTAAKRSAKSPHTPAHAAEKASEEQKEKPAAAGIGEDRKATAAGKRTARSAGAPRPRPGPGPGRAYRRAPAPEVLVAAYEQTGSIAGVAAKFDVPVHTAQGWISRLRQKATPQELGS